MIDYSPFQRALAQLQESFAFFNSENSRSNPRLRAQFRAAVIQAFEFTYGLGTKMISRQLSEIVSEPPDLNELAFLDLMRVAADKGLIASAPPFKTYREKRNITSHTYDEAKAEDVLTVMGDFIEDMRFLLGQLERRNRGEA